MKRSHWIILPESFPLLAVGLIITVFTYVYWGWIPTVIPVLFLLFTCWFFRNPERKARAEAHEVLSPADGVVLAVESVEESRYLKKQAIKVSIFLNVFNVHVNRSPIEGRIEFVHYQPGKFLPAFKSHASEINERNYVGIRSTGNPDWQLLVVQITGFVARRIVFWGELGQHLLQGQRFGMIKFGSCTEIYLPQDTEILVTQGQKVKGGMTVIGRLQNG